MNQYTILDHDGTVIGHIQNDTTSFDILQKIYPGLQPGHRPLVPADTSMPTAASMRTHRNNLLHEVDKINPVRYNSLTQQQQQELANYRQSLLGVPQQAGFPLAIEWPSKPTWL